MQENKFLPPSNPNEFRTSSKSFTTKASTMAPKSVTLSGPLFSIPSICSPLIMSAQYLVLCSSPSCLFFTTLFALSKLSPVIGLLPNKSDIVS